MQYETCEKCNAFKSTNPKGGICRANPPTLLVFGMEQVRVPGLHKNGSQVGQRPVTGSGFPETPNEGWCRQFTLIENVRDVTVKQDLTPFTFDAAKCQPIGEVSPVGGGLLSERGE